MCTGCCSRPTSARRYRPARAGLSPTSSPTSARPTAGPSTPYAPATRTRRRWSPPLTDRPRWRAGTARAPPPCSARCGPPARTPSAGPSGRARVRPRSGSAGSPTRRRCTAGISEPRSGGTPATRTALAVDGVDEVVTMFFPRQVRLGRIPPLTPSLAVRPRRPRPVGCWPATARRPGRTRGRRGQRPGRRAGPAALGPAAARRPPASPDRDPGRGRGRAVRRHRALTPPSLPVGGAWPV